MTSFVDSLRDNSNTDAHQIAIVASAFYPEIAENLVLGAKKALSEEDLAPALIYHVAGALEIPLAIKLIHESSTWKYSGYIALGCVIRGETYHFEIVATQSAQALLHQAMQPDFPPIVNGILTVDTFEQAQSRSLISGGNRGGHAARALMPLLRLRV